MYRVKSRIELQEKLEKLRSSPCAIGFVPTMGALHAGHISLIKKAKAENRFVVASVFVNPTQFNNAEDLQKYPRMPEEDAALLNEAGCDLLWMPEFDDVYSGFPEYNYQLGELETILEGKFRPGHFKGVAQVVGLLMEAIKPDNSYFGIKDFQQVKVIEQVVKKRGFSTNVIACPIVREPDGLAMSSRNLLLNPEERKAASNIPLWLNEAKRRVMALESIPGVLESIKKKIGSESLFKLEYLEIRNAENLDEVKEIIPNKHYVILFAAWCGKIRLIDNLLIP